MPAFRRLLLVFTFLWLGAPAIAATPEPVSLPGPQPVTLAERAARRFPQPVRVGDLIGRQVLQPTEAQHVLGRIEAITRGADGGLAVLVRFGGLLGFASRPIAVPIEAVALLGEYVAIMDFSPAQLQQFPTATNTGATSLAPDEMIRVGLAKPFH